MDWLPALPDRSTFGLLISYAMGLVALGGGGWALWRTPLIERKLLALVPLGLWLTGELGIVTAGASWVMTLLQVGGFVGGLLVTLDVERALVEAQRRRRGERGLAARRSEPDVLSACRAPMTAEAFARHTSEITIPF